MVRPALKFALLATLVVAGHLVTLEWIGRQADAIPGLTPMAPTMYTRVLRPATPPPVVAVATPAPAPKPRPRAATRPKPKASEPRQAKKPEPPPEPPAAEPSPAEEPALAQAEPTQAATDVDLAAQAPAGAASEPAQLPTAAASQPAQAASAAEPAQSAASQPQAPTALDSWPTDTRLTYQLGGEWRGPLFGRADVQWQRQDEKYQVRLEVKIRVFGTQVLTSQGEVTPDGLLLRAYEELRPGKRRTAHLGDSVVLMENGKTAPRPPGVQDTASQFVELSHRFATGRAVLEVGRTVDVWLARPGGLDLWTYDIVGRETLRTPQLGDVEAFHLKPRMIPNARGNITAEMWFAPSLQYLPVRIKVIMGNEAYLDLLVEQIEQR